MGPHCENTKAWPFCLSAAGLGLMMYDKFLIIIFIVLIQIGYLLLKINTWVQQEWILRMGNHVF